jgi:glycosyltransferase involved in cell wall biosynthesis
MQKNLSISVVLPAYNEVENIEHTIDSSALYLAGRSIDYEIIVVNDGSTDGTDRLVEELARQNPRIRLINHPQNLGYGSALRSGFERASLDYIFLMDSDGQFDISDLDRFLPHINEFNAIIGYREKRADSIVRSLNAWMYHIFIHIVFDLKAKDMDCAFKLFPRDIYRAIRPIQSNGALFSAEFLLKFHMHGFSILEIPVRHFPRQFGTQTGASLRVIFKMFKECWRLKRELDRTRTESQIQLNPGTLLGINHMR